MGCTFCIVSLTRSTPPSASSPSAYRGIEHLSKSTPHRLKERPETAQAPPRRPANAPKTPPIRQTRPEHTPRRFMNPPKRPQAPQDAHKPFPSRPRDGFKTAPRRQLGDPWGAKNLEKTMENQYFQKSAQDAQKPPKTHPRCPKMRPEHPRNGPKSLPRRQLGDPPRSQKH